MKGLIHIGSNDGREYQGTDRLTLLFEPQQDVFDRAIALHAGNPNVICVKTALGFVNGFCKMYKSTNNGLSSSILKPKKHLEIMPQIQFSGEEEVPVIKLDDFFTQNFITQTAADFDEIVIDVQGYELEVLKGAVTTLENINKITAEVNTDEVYEGCAQMDQLDNFLEPLDFKRTKTSLYGGCWGDAVYEKQ